MIWALMTKLSYKIKESLSRKTYGNRLSINLVPMNRSHNKSYTFVAKVGSCHPSLAPPQSSFSARGKLRMMKPEVAAINYCLNTSEKILHILF